MEREKKKVKTSGSHRRDDGPMAEDASTVPHLVGVVEKTRNTFVLTIRSGLDILKAKDQRIGHVRLASLPVCE
ncbi:hypothetical protein J6590_010135 [Homalodisca vitripennis]|nr:hypothetical protein J6590_010135 [Homalodisca vitripennis]